MINFPASPTPGQVFTNGVSRYVFDGTVWKSATLGTALPLNYVLNPAFQINQANIGTVTTSGAHLMEGWRVGFGNTAVVSFSRVASVTQRGSPYRLRAVVSTADATLTTTDHCHIMGRLESVKSYPFGWGNASLAKPAVMNFGWRSPAGTYSFNIRDSDLDYGYITSFTVAAGQANTDVYFTIPIPAPPAGAGGPWPVANDSNLGLQFSFGIAFGPTYQTATPGWQGGSVYSLNTMTNGLAAVSNTFELFDVGLYVDPNNTGKAPPWQYTSDRQALFDAHRYFQRVQGSMGVSYASTSTPNRSSTASHARMRVPPAASVIGTPRGWDQAVAPNITGITNNYSNVFYFEQNFTAASAMTGGGRGTMLVDTSNAIYIAEDARL